MLFIIDLVFLKRAELELTNKLRLGSAQRVFFYVFVYFLFRISIFPALLYIFHVMNNIDYVIMNLESICLSGRTWQAKVSDMREAMESAEVDMMVVTGLDETACKFWYLLQMYRHWLNYNKS